MTLWNKKLRGLKQRFKSEDSNAESHKPSKQYSRGRSLPLDVEDERPKESSSDGSIDRQRSGTLPRSSPVLSDATSFPPQAPVRMPVPIIAIEATASAPAAITYAATMPTPSIDSPAKSPTDVVQQLSASGVIAQINAGQHKAPSKTEKVIKNITDTIAVGTDTVEQLSGVAQPIQLGLESGVMQGIETKLRTFFEDIPWLMKGLDEVARVHPAVTVVVLAFKAVYSMEMTRRENDKRVRSLYVEMKDMIHVLIHLRDVKDPKDKGPDGEPLDARLEKISEQAAKDIKECANVCDTYARKRPVVRILKGYAWESRLIGYIAVFEKRRAQFEEALAIRTARSVDAMRTSMKQVEAIVTSIDDRLALFMKLFEKYVPKDEAQLAEVVKKKGDIRSIQNNEKILRELVELDNNLESNKGSATHERGTKRDAFTLKDLREELHEDTEVAIKNNFETFRGKFELYQRQLQQELEKFIADMNNRLLIAVKEGPHDRIRNEELREMWKEMNWRRNVKARLFVMTLRDHFRDKLQDMKLIPGDTDTLSSAEPLGLDALAKRIDETGPTQATTQKLQASLKTFHERMPRFMKSLDKVAQLHPFTTDSVIAFKSAYTLEMTRPKSDERIMLLYVVMKDMMGSLIPLCDAMGADGMTLQAQLEKTLAQISADIEHCANVCDSYSRKSALLLVFQRQTWESRLAEYFATFENHRIDVQMALAAHGGNGTVLVEPSTKRDEPDTQASNQRQTLFGKLRARLAESLNKYGGVDTIKGDEKILHELLQMESELDSGDTGEDRSIMRPSVNIKGLEDELQEDIETALRKNFETFQPKYETQQKQVEPTFEDLSESPQGLDDWAFQYISLAWLQPIMEAFDDDGSGYITVAEINKFTEAMPASLKWSLQHWIAYWAVGWEISANHYRIKIQEIFACIKSALGGLLFGLRDDSLPDIQYKFQAYMDHEEERITKNLEAIHYDIDALDTVYVVAGPGRIEKHIFTLAYLLLKRDLELFRLGQRHILHADELWDAADSLLWVFDALFFRVEDLQEQFKQQHIDIDQQFKTICCESLKSYHDNSELWAMSQLQGDKFMFYVNPWDLDDGGKDKDPDRRKLLNYELPADSSKQTYMYEEGYEWELHEMTAADNGASLPLKAIVGQWNGYLYNYSEYPSYVILTFNIHATASGDQEFEASGKNFDGISFTLSGSCQEDGDGFISVKFSIVYDKDHDTEFFTGHFDDDGSFVGYMALSDAVSDFNWDQRFIFRKVPIEVMISRPFPHEFDDNKPRALWKFATSYALNEVRKKAWSWSYFHQRRDIRRNYIKLNIAHWTYGRPPLNEEFEEYLRIRKSLKPSDASYYRSVRDHFLDVILPDHNDLTCVSCDKALGGVRIICLDCQPPKAKLYETIDFCNHPKCLEIEVESTKFSFLEPKRPHKTTHDLLKLRTVMHRRDMPRVIRDAKSALANARSQMENYFDVRIPTPLLPEPNGDAVVDDQKDVCSETGTPTLPNEDSMSIQKRHPGEVLEASGSEVLHLDESPSDPAVPSATTLGVIGSTSELIESPASEAEVTRPVSPATTYHSSFDEPEPQRSRHSESPSSDLTDLPVAGYHDSRRASIAGPDIRDASPEVHEHDKETKSPTPRSPASNPPNKADNVSVASTVVPIPWELHCCICLKLLPSYKEMPCWFCVPCSQFVCDDCESRELIQCQACRRAFESPSYWYGSNQNDTFLCNKCTLKGRTASGWMPTYHTTTHPLVRCKEHVEDPIDPPELTTEERIIALETRVGTMDEKLEGLETRLSSMLTDLFSHMEQNVLSFLSSKANGDSAVGPADVS